MSNFPVTSETSAMILCNILKWDFSLAEILYAFPLPLPPANSLDSKGLLWNKSKLFHDYLLSVNGIKIIQVLQHTEIYQSAAWRHYFWLQVLTPKILLSQPDWYRTKEIHVLYLFKILNSRKIILQGYPIWHNGQDKVIDSEESQSYLYIKWPSRICSHERHFFY